eukprot:6103799-Prymnesium_polylepis.1
MPCARALRSKPNLALRTRRLMTRARRASRRMRRSARFRLGRGTRGSGQHVCGRVGRMRTCL